MLSDVDAADLMTGKKVRPGSLDRLDQDPGAGVGGVCFFFAHYGFQARVSREEPPFEDIDGTGLHFERQGKARLIGRKIANATRVDLFTSVAKLLRELVTHRRAVVVGRGQGAVVLLLSL